MTANPSIFTPDRCIGILPIATVHDTLTGMYTAWYPDMPWLIVQVEDKEQARDELREVMVVYLKSICKK